MKLNPVIVDDDRILHFLLDIMLQEVQISDPIISLHDGNEFITWWREQSKITEKYLVFLDLNMPLTNGWMVLDELQRADAKNILVVIITSSIDTKDRKRAEKYAMVIDFIVKPIQLQDLEDLKNACSIHPYFCT